ncbi:bifunctional diaminohydroxyphosphoribosylaminopyrimidine deaminase/5-amino-6-(5-phosphoribosylamino)uracil reductase RibD [bacterium]|jgi:diaminohydroxyphosphoribosylaminopyrimidine deaminase/5-amino-6-(5-phosphoribosylamino)uracil reductase|nr:bifunctional diaminohydroxyphosphoribosylaminopyrimidine deaminase/5-amino-6-(5-phosphoribosylamino)uracil reductase RibD [bacterium]
MPVFTDMQKKWMLMALEEAGKVVGLTAPNPAVGAVLVKNNRLIARSYHKYPGGLHAEANAISLAGPDARGADLYVTLEPCSSTDKRTPPCTEAIIRTGIKRVFSAITDPNPVHCGRGYKKLRKKNVSVFDGLLSEQAREINLPFFKRVIERLPFVTLKFAQSLDGKIATRTGDSKWISSVPSRKMTHILRSRNDAVMTGINTVLADNPFLTVRHIKSKKQPLRIIVDSRYKIPLTSNVLRNDDAKTLVAGSSGPDRKKGRKIISMGHGTVRIKKDKTGLMDMKALLKYLLHMGINSVLVESGGALAASLLEKNLVDRVIYIIAPVLIGGHDAITSFEGKGIGNVSDAVKVEGVNIKRCGPDFVLTGELNSGWRKF